MAKICYQEKKFTPVSLKRINIANAIIAEYQAQGFDLTLRQLYYQFVSRDLIVNKQSEYAKLGSVINDARVAGLIDWDAIVDRTRNLQKNSHWSGPREIIEVCAKQFQIDKWENQEHRVEVWIEKDALIGVIQGICQSLDVPYFSCRGYTSQSEMHVAAKRLERWVDNGQTPIIIHMGDHDPSGIDMTRDITERLELFMGGTQVMRVALNDDQIQKYKPPPNPSKVTDPRAGIYIQKFGRQSWELDALDPKVLASLIKNTVKKYRNDDLWAEKVEEENEHRASLEKVAKKLE